MKKVLFNPFEQFSERPLIIFGLTATLLLSWTSAYFNARFDGVLDLHFRTPTFFINTLTDNVLNIVILALFLFFLGKFRNNKTRFIDIFAAALIARIPYYLLPFINYNDTILIESEKLLKQFINLPPGAVPQFENSVLGILVFFSIISLVVLAWYIFLLYQGYKVATNAKSATEALLFIVTILIAELFSKTIFYFIN
jgi:hypothetical protein